MNFEIRKVENKKIWEDFLLNCSEKSFLQSWNWGKFQLSMRNDIWRLGIYEKDELIGIGLVSKIKARRGTFLLVQHGPAVNLNFKKEEILKVFLEELKKIGEKEKAVFIRMNPLWESNPGNQAIFKNLGFKEAQMHANSYEATWKLNITVSEEELLNNMRKTTRYLIRQTEKNPDIKVESSNDARPYQELNEEVAARQKFIPFSFEYVRNEFESFSKDNQSVLFFGKYKDEVVAAVMLIIWSGIAFYHQAASSSKYQRFSIPYLLQWEAIKEAKKRGCSLYDFWGFIDPQKNPGHPWAGPTLFKMGFGGKSYQEYSNKLL